MSLSFTERALVVRLSSIGDVIHTMPAFMALRRAAPSARLGWVVEPAAAPLVQRLPGPLRVHVLDTHAWRRRWWHPSVTREIKAGMEAGFIAVGDPAVKTAMILGVAIRLAVFERQKMIKADRSTVDRELRDAVSAILAD